jgi:hypothetical protein
MSASGEEEETTPTLSPISAIWNTGSQAAPVNRSNLPWFYQQTPHKRTRIGISKVSLSSMKCRFERMDTHQLPIGEIHIEIHRPKRGIEFFELLWTTPTNQQLRWRLSLATIGSAKKEISFHLDCRRKEWLLKLPSKILLDGSEWKALLSSSRREIKGNSINRSVFHQLPRLKGLWCYNSFCYPTIQPTVSPV